MKRPSPNLFQNLIYTLVWALVFLLPVFVHSQDGEVSWTRLWLFWARAVPFLVLFPIHNYLLVPRLLLRGRWWWYAGSLAALLVALFSVAHPFVLHNVLEPVIQREMPRMLPDGAPRMHPRRLPMMFNDYVVAILVAGFNIAIRYLFKSMRDERQIRDLEASRAELPQGADQPAFLHEHAQ